MCSAALTIYCSSEPKPLGGFILPSSGTQDELDISIYIVEFGFPGILFGIRAEPLFDNAIFWRTGHPTAFGFSRSPGQLPGVLEKTCGMRSPHRKNLASHTTSVGRLEPSWAPAAHQLGACPVFEVVCHAASSSLADVSVLPALPYRELNTPTPMLERQV